jgi:heat shock protein HslJ
MLFPAATAVKAMDANVRNYKTSNSESELTILISQSICINEMSGIESKYSVVINYKSKQESMDLKGCGDFITDYRLYDIWVLESLNGNKITKTDFSREFPNLEINTNTNTFMGFAGCNSMNGKLFFEKGLLRFTDIATTRMMCEPTNKEADFLLALKRSTAYEIGNNRLTLSNPDGETLVFKKVD